MYWLVACWATVVPMEYSFTSFPDLQAINILVPFVLKAIAVG